jgi:hypothetical protein
MRRSGGESSETRRNVFIFTEPDDLTMSYEMRYRAFHTLIETLTPWFRACPHKTAREGR